MSLNPLPSPRIIATELLVQLQNVTSSSTGAISTAGNSLKNANDETKKILLTFHVLYPNEFLPALDLLDRRLLTRFTIRPTQAEAETSSTAQQPSNPTPLYFVRTAQQPRTTTTSRSYDPLATHYEVRPTAWNCSCAAFAFAAFPAATDAERGAAPDDDGRLGPHQSGVRFLRFGGLSAGSAAPPVCKHLLACVLAEHCEVFRGCAEEKEVSIEEVAGWCAGWGD